MLAALNEAVARPTTTTPGSAPRSGCPSRRALVAFADGDFAGCADLLRAIRGIAHRFGGSHAQRDVIDLTLIEAAIRAGNGALARGLAAERAAMRHESPLSHLFLRRAAALAA